MVEDSPEELVYDLFSNHFYPRHPLGRPIHGTEATVAGLSRSRLLEYFREAYVPGNLLVVAAGNVEHGAVARLLRKAFGGWSRRGSRAASGGAPRPHAGVVTRAKKELEQLHLLMGLPAFPERDEHRYPLYVLNTLLGGTMSSRLFQKIREQRGLAYSVYSATNAFLDSGVMLIYAGTSPRKGDEVLDVVLGELAELRDKGPAPAEVRVAKEHLRGSLMLSLESTSSRMSNLARQEIYHGRQLSSSEVLRRVESVKVEDVHDVARRIFRGGRLALAAVGRISHLRSARAGLSL